MSDAESLEAVEPARPKPRQVDQVPVPAPAVIPGRAGGALFDTGMGAGMGAPSAPTLLRHLERRPPEERKSAVDDLNDRVGNRHVARMIARNVLARDPTGAAPPAPAPAPRTANVSPAFNLEIPEIESLKLEVGKASYVKGSLALKGEIQFVPVEAGVEASNNTVGPSTGAQGAKAEIEIEARKEVVAFGKSIGFEKVEEALTFEAGLKKLEISLGLTAKAKTKYDWCKGVVEGKIIGIGVEWEKITEASAGAIEVSGGFAGEGKITLGGIDYIAKPKVTITGRAELNWAKIAAKAAEEGIKQGAKEGAKGAVEAVATEAGVSVIAVDGAAVGAAVAAIAVPLAAAVAMGYGAFQAMKNAKTATEAAGLGVQLRDKANLWAKNYAKTLTSHKAEGEGAAEAEAQIKAIMDQTHAPREFVIAKINSDRGGYNALREEALKKIKPKLYDEAVKAFEESHQKDFGMIESLGPTWGERGVFRDTLTQVLMADTAVGGG
jgi:hypothetical protein